MPVSRTALTVRPVLVVTALIVSMMTSWEISGDQQAPGAGAGRPAGTVPPGPDRGDGERAGVVVRADVNPAGVGGQVIDPVGHHLAQLLVSEVVHADPLGLTAGRIFRAAVLEVADVLLFLGVHADHRAAVILERGHLGVDVPLCRCRHSGTYADPGIMLTWALGGEVCAVQASCGAAARSA